MHILLSIEHFNAATGGAEGFAVAVVRRLIQRGHRLSILAVDGTAMPGVESHQAPMHQWPEVAAAIKPDVTLDWGLNIPADVHRLGGGIHRAFMRYNLQGRSWLGRLLKYAEYQFTPKHRRIIAREHRLLTLPGTRCLAVSRFVADQVINTLDIDRNRVFVLINGVDGARFRPAGPDQRRDSRVRLGLTDQQVACIFVAHNLHLKNLPLMARAFAALYAQNPAIRLVVVGKRCPRFSAPWLIYAGTTSQPEQIYQAADMLVHPTFYDACANVVLEAMATGIPVLSSDQNGSSEIVTNGESGFVLPVSGHPSAVIVGKWHDGIQQLADSPARRATMGAAARSAALQHSLDQYTDDLEAFLLQ